MERRKPEEIKRNDVCGDYMKDEVVEIPKETLDFFGGDELRARVFYEKYTLRDVHGNKLEKTPDEMWRRISREIAGVEQNEAKKKEWAEKFYSVLEGFKFIPGGRIMFGAGQPKRKVTLLNCYVIPIKEDSIEGIFQWCKEAAKTYSYSGGVGGDISILRPRMAPVHNSSMYSTGAVSFMEIMSQTTGIIGQAGRRGALMITISVDHPDIFEFIKVKRNLKSVRFANISVKVTDEFMKAVEDDKDFTLRYESPDAGKIERTVKARELWKELVTSARDWAEPGIMFWDNIRKYSPSEYNGMNVLTTNPCSEQPLDPYNACDLGHVNLKKFVNNPFSEKAEVNWKDLETTIRYGVRFLDNVLTYNMEKHPLKEQTEASRNSRRIGLGFTALGDMLVMLGIKYDSEEALKFVDQFMDRMKTWAYDESTNISEEKGQFPLFDSEKHLSMPFIKNLSDDLKAKIKKNGLRNVAILTIAPVGSGSVLAGTSSGIEPIFAFSYTRRSESLSKEFFKIYHPTVMEYMKKFGLKSEDELPEFFVPAHKIKPDFRVNMQAVIQKHIDSAISSTVNLPESTTVEEVANIYMQAWKAGCKSISIYRDNSRESVLLTEEKAKELEKNESPLPQAEKVYRRPNVMMGQTVRMNLVDESIYVTTNSDDKGLREVFINIGKSGYEDKSYCEALGKLISLYLQHDGDPNMVVQKLKGIQGNNVSWDNGMKLLSVPDAIAKAIEAMIGKSQQMTLADAKPEPLKAEQHRNARQASDSDYKTIGISTCPKCHEESLVNENGCIYCKECGYSKCD